MTHIALLKSFGRAAAINNISDHGDELLAQPVSIEMPVAWLSQFGMKDSQLYVSCKIFVKGTRLFMIPLDNFSIHPSAAVLNVESQNNHIKVVPQLTKERHAWDDAVSRMIRRN